jgi:hypothetical protein
MDTMLTRTQPISFDELISKAIASGIEERGWKPKLKRFLDLQVIKTRTSSHLKLLNARESPIIRRIRLEIGVGTEPARGFAGRLRLHIHVRLRRWERFSLLF